MGRRAIALISLALLAALVGVCVAAPASADRLRPPGKKAQRIKSQLQNRLEARGLDNVDVRRCVFAKKVRGANTIRCTWYSEGVNPGPQPYRCHGSALYGKLPSGKLGFIGISRCKNQAPTLIPAAANRVSEPLFGYADAWDQSSQSLLDTFGRLRPDLARSGFAWTTVESKRGSYDWWAYDALYAELLSRGIRPLWIVYAAPCWAQKRPSKCVRTGKPAPKHYDELADFAAAAAQRYPEIGALEILNEPNMKKYWGGRSNPKLYAELFKTVEEEVEKVDPSLPVLFGGLSPHAKSRGGTLAAAKFLRRGYKFKAVRQSDGISTHPFPGTAPREDVATAIRKRLGDLWKVMRRKRDTQRPLWITETGVSTVGSRAHSGEEQARALTEIVEVTRRIPQVKALILHRFQDAHGDNRFETGYGSVDSEGRPKPAYCAIGRSRGLTVC